MPSTRVVTATTSTLLWAPVSLLLNTTLSLLTHPVSIIVATIVVTIYAACVLSFIGAYQFIWFRVRALERERLVLLERLCAYRGPVDPLQHHDRLRELVLYPLRQPAFYCSLHHTQDAFESCGEYRASLDTIREIVDEAERTRREELEAEYEAEKAQIKTRVVIPRPSRIVRHIPGEGFREVPQVPIPPPPAPVTYQKPLSAIIRDLHAKREAHKAENDRWRREFERNERAALRFRPPPPKASRLPVVAPSLPQLRPSLLNTPKAKPQPQCAYQPAVARINPQPNMLYSSPPEPVVPTPITSGTASGVAYLQSLQAPLGIVGTADRQTQTVGEPPQFPPIRIRDFVFSFYVPYGTVACPPPPCIPKHFSSAKMSRKKASVNENTKRKEREPQLPAKGLGVRHRRSMKTGDYYATATTQKYFTRHSQLIESEKMRNFLKKNPRSLHKTLEERRRSLIDEIMFDDTEDDDAFFFPTTTTALHVAPGLPQQDTNCANASGPFAYHIDVAGTYWAPLAPSPLFPEPAPSQPFIPQNLVANLNTGLAADFWAVASATMAAEAPGTSLNDFLATSTGAPTTTWTDPFAQLVQPQFGFVLPAEQTQQPPAPFSFNFDNTTAGAPANTDPIDMPQLTAESLFAPPHLSDTTNRNRRRRRQKEAKPKGTLPSVSLVDPDDYGKYL